MSENEKELSLNETDPRLRFDAFTGGIQNGGLRSISSINIMVCYLVAKFPNKITAKIIADGLCEGMIANYFETTDAISKLKNNNVVLENEDGTLHLTRANEEAVDLVEKDLPLSVREKGIHVCQKLIAKTNFKKENKVDITKIENGYNITLRVSDNDSDFMVLTLYAASRTQAEVIKEKFISNPIHVYQNLIDSIFENED